MVIEKFRNSKCTLFYVPRYGDVSGTNIRNSLANNNDVSKDVDNDVTELIKASL